MFEKLTAERLREVLDYAPKTGVFTWRMKRGRAAAGSIAGCKHKHDGRIYIGIDGRLYKAHRLAWLYMKGAWPPAGIDHRDGIPDHNWIANLRPATQAQNSQNQRRAHRDSSTGLLGVQGRRGRWHARVKSGALLVFGKTRESPTEAHADYLEIKAIFHPFSTIGANA